MVKIICDKCGLDLTPVSTAWVVNIHEYKTGKDTLISHYCNPCMHDIMGGIEVAVKTSMEATDGGN